MMAAFYKTKTHDVTVSVEPTFLPKDSTPEKGEYLWAYHVEIHNDRPEPIYLRNRHWVITDALGRITEVKGQGVVGEEPLIAPGETYSYTSGTPLATPSGIMVGAYEMERPNGELFVVEVPAFSLDSPHDKRTVH